MPTALYRRYFSHFIQHSNVPPRETFKFNNSPFAFHDDNSQAMRDNNQERDWILGQMEMGRFFDALNKLQPFNLRVSGEKWAHLEKQRKILHGRQGMVEITCDKLINLFCHVFEPVKERTMDGTYATVCSECKNNCCKPCSASYYWKRLCEGMTFFGGQCKICKHHMDKHEYGQKQYIQKPIFRSTENQDEKNRHRYTSLVSFIEVNGDSIVNHGNELDQMLSDITELYNEVNESSLQHTHKDVSGMIDTYIMEEMGRESCGFKDRIRILEQLKEERTKPKGSQWRDLHDCFLLHFLPELKDTKV